MNGPEGMSKQRETGSKGVVDSMIVYKQKAANASDTVSRAKEGGRVRLSVTKLPNVVCESYC